MDAIGADAGVHTAPAENRMQDALIWIDLEMTGEYLSPAQGLILRRIHSSMLDHRGL